MKNSWIKVEDKLPEMWEVSPSWHRSDNVLALVQGMYPVISVLNHNEPFGPPEWLYEGRGGITHWQPITLPE